MSLVNHHLGALFPRGCNGEGKWHTDNCPIWPPDLFGAMANLLELSGAYHRIDFAGARQKGLLSLTQAEQKRVRKLSGLWRGKDGLDQYIKGSLPDGIAKLWKEFKKVSRGHAVLNGEASGDLPPWWKHALMLFLIADEACHMVGFVQPDDKRDWIDVVVDSRQDDARPESVTNEFNFATIGEYLNSDMVSVTPKGIQPSVGCTMRSISRNLAATPAQGVAKANWSYFTKGRQNDEDRPLNILLVPFPFAISAHCFRAVQSKASKGRWYEVDQLWLHEDKVTMVNEMQEFVLQIVDNAEADGTKVDGLVFPELSLSPVFFLAVLKALWVKTNVKFCVAGVSRPIDGDVMEKHLSSDQTDYEIKDYTADSIAAKDQPVGNYVATYVNYGLLNGDGEPDGGFAQVSYREKHHWWILEETQIETYAIGDVLSPQYIWKEKLTLGKRAIDVISLNKALTFTSLICEDLARMDPCQQLVRSVGPNLVFALLMDGPQLRSRWSAKYANVLAEDPGAAVLSLTSKGLINRQNQSEAHEASHVVALWRDAAGKTKEINLPKDRAAVLLKLRAKSGTAVHPVLGDESDRWDWVYVGHTTVEADIKSWMRKCAKPADPD